MGRLQEVKKEQELLRRYQYDGRGNRTQMLLQEAGVQKETRYQYNLLEQLETETSNGMERKYRYDGRGNLTQVLENGKEHHHYQYGALNRMEKAVDAQGKTAEYQYSGLGFRTGRTENANQISYVLDLTREYHNLLYCQEEEKETSFLWDNGAALLETEGNVTSYISDSLGSPLRLLDEMGEVKESYGYDEFGCDLYGNSGQTQPFGFAGYEADKVSGTSFAQAREYQPETGRFVSEDPIKGFVEHPITLNHYAYCFNNPLVLVDNNGAWPSLSDIKNGISNACGAVADVVGGAVESAKQFVNDHGKLISTAVVIGALAVGSIMATAPIVAAVFAGAAIGATIETGFQAYDIHKSGGNIFDQDAYNYKKIIFSGAVGAVTGLVSGGAAAVSASVSAKIKISEKTIIALGNTAIGSVSSVIDSQLDGEKLTAWEVVKVGIQGGIIGGVSGYAGKKLGDLFENTRFMKNLEIKKRWSRPIWQLTLGPQAIWRREIVAGNKKVFDRLVKEGRVIELLSNLLIDGGLNRIGDIMGELIRKSLDKLDVIFDKNVCTSEA